MKKTKNDIKYIRERLVRVIVRYKNGNVGAGTGFIVSENGVALTCFHVIFGSELKTITNTQEYITVVGENVHDKLQNYFDKFVSSIEIEFLDGTRKKATLKKFNESYDVASLLIDGENKFPNFDLDITYTPEYDTPVFFCGYQLASGYDNPEQYPFATNRAIISSFPDVIVAGDKYKHIQLNSINLGGNSGAPLFEEGGNKVVGIINGNMNWGSDNLAFITMAQNQTNLTKGALRVPLSIAFSTPISLIKSETDILE